jgi:hypothetical protein
MESPVAALPGIINRLVGDVAGLIGEVERKKAA